MLILHIVLSLLTLPTLHTLRTLLTLLIFITPCSVQRWCDDPGDDDDQHG
jgi:hypothetical protein